MDITTESIIIYRYNYSCFCKNENTLYNSQSFYIKKIQNKYINFRIMSYAQIIKDGMENYILGKIINVIKKKNP